MFGSMLGNEGSQGPARKPLDSSNEPVKDVAVGLRGPHSRVIRLARVGHLCITQLDDAAVHHARGGFWTREEHSGGPPRFHAKPQGSAHPQSFESGATRRIAFKKANAECGTRNAESSGGLVISHCSPV